MERGRKRGWMLWRVMLLIFGACASRCSQPLALAFPARALRLQLFPSRSCTASTSQWARRSRTHIDQSQDRDLTANEYEAITTGGLRWPLEPMGDARGSGRGEGWRVRARSLAAKVFFVVWARGRNFSEHKRGGSLQERALPPNRFRPGAGRFGLVWFSLDTNASRPCYVLKR